MRERGERGGEGGEGGEVQEFQFFLVYAFINETCWMCGNYTHFLCCYQPWEAGGRPLGGWWEVGRLPFHRNRRWKLNPSLRLALLVLAPAFISFLCFSFRLDFSNFRLVFSIFSIFPIFPILVCALHATRKRQKRKKTTRKTFPR